MANFGLRSLSSPCSNPKNAFGPCPERPRGLIQKLEPSIIDAYVDVRNICFCTEQLFQVLNTSRFNSRVPVGGLRRSYRSAVIPGLCSPAGQFDLNSIVVRDRTVYREETDRRRVAPHVVVAKLHRIRQLQCATVI